MYEHIKTGWDYVKHLMALAHCGGKRCYGTETYWDDLERPMIVAFMKDDYGYYSTIFMSLNGSPPKAFAGLQANAFELGKVNGEFKVFLWGNTVTEEIPVHFIAVYDSGFKTYRRITLAPGPVNVDVEFKIGDLLSRKDVLIMNFENLPNRTG